MLEMRLRRLAAVFVVAMYQSTFAGPAAALDVFPGAKGYGRAAQAGRGGRIIYVTNLKDAGPGSLRACAEGTGKRVCVFRVGGNIVLKSPIGIRTANGRVSILGQTAPGGGILLTVDPNTTSFIKTPFYLKNTQEVLIRHIRVRPQYPNSITTSDALLVENSSDVYIDHVSGSWATDENFNVYGSTTDLTVAYSVWAEGLENHSKCALLGSDPVGPQRMSFWRNICASNNDRNPDDNHFGGSCIEITNNLFYNNNAKNGWAEVFATHPGGTPVSYVSNYFKAGPATPDVSYAISYHPIGAVAAPAIYHAGNGTWAPGSDRIVPVSPETEPHLVDNPTCRLALPAISAQAAYQDVRAKAGAFPRDSVDDRIISEIGPMGIAGSGSIKTAPGELPHLSGGTPYLDADRDGMADSREFAFGAAAGTYDPWADPDGDGWPSLDEFMQWLSARRVAGSYVP
jgi:hypothetical protein